MKRSAMFLIFAWVVGAFFWGYFIKQYHDQEISRISIINNDNTLSERYMLNVEFKGKGFHVPKGESMEIHLDDLTIYRVLKNGELVPVKSSELDEVKELREWKWAKLEEGFDYNK